MLRDAPKVNWQQYNVLKFNSSLYFSAFYIYSNILGINNW